MTKARECGTKFRHDSKAGADAQAASLHRNRAATPATAHVYRCPHCGGWHVGHRKQRGRRR